MYERDAGIFMVMDTYGDVPIYRLRGSFNIASSRLVLATLREAASTGCKLIIVDLRAVTFLDPTGLGAMIGAQRRAIENGGTLRLVVSEDQIVRLLNVPGLNKVFAVHDSIVNALRSHARASSMQSVPVASRQTNVPCGGAND